ncbi:MAG: D-glycerate dehydrogenase [Bacteroidota bacterium]
MKPRVFLTRRLPAAAIQRLQDQVDLELNPDDRVLSPSELLAGARDKDGLLCLLTDTIDAPLLEACPKLKVISNYAVGYNNIDVAAATQRGIPVTNTPGILTETSADLAFSLLLAVSRRIAEADRFVRTGQWKGWGPLQFLGTDIHQAHLGIIGMGRIGKAMARRARGFDMTVSYWNRTRLSNAEEATLGLTYQSLETLLAQADFVSLHLAYHPETHHLIGARELSKMKKTAFLINTARGAIIDEAALVTALQKGTLAGAGLDVYEAEPFITPALLAMDQVVVLPHIGSATQATRTRMAHLAVDHLLAVFNGQRPTHLVNPAVWT